MSDSDQPTGPATMDRWLPYLTPQDSDAALRLAVTMVKAGLMDGEEAAAWSARLRAWKLAHTTIPTEA